MTNLLLTVLQEGFLYGVLAMGAMMTYNIMGIADLSVDGSYPLGVVVSAVLIVNGVNPWIALVVSFLAGAIAGSLTGLLHVKLKITSLLSGILVMTGLYSVNLMIAGGVSNIPLFGEKTLLDTTWLSAMNLPAWVVNFYPVLVLFVIAMIAKVGVDWILSTRAGYLLKVTGDNEGLVLTLGENSDVVKVLGLALSNGLVALSGGMGASLGRYFDISLGAGMVVMALSSVLLGTLLLSKTRLKMTTQVIIGAMIYRLIVAIAIKWGLNPIHLKLITVGIFITTIIFTNNPLSKFVRKKENDNVTVQQYSQNIQS
ncbi:ABC transporter [Erysipelothrix larvae]|uniref:ABC transporter n=1 Tax=Erysipelothrix larvae TaxID=1514105 RepID=A0A0X8H1B3_9FIRM|nr:ABC transporter [Erysipelothrix larvae]AMC94284.1 ABC transporter [Erysipelothrix larvae]